jgi:hypothetical protein
LVGKDKIDLMTFSPRIGDMFTKRCFNRLATPLIMALLLCAGMPMATSQDSAGIWEDSTTGLIWSVKDNGSDMSWDQANNYCENSTLQGQTDWRLPTIDELKTLYDRSLSKKQYKAKGPIELGAASMWSGTKNNSGDAWNFNFFNGGTSMSPTRGGCGTSARALCVRQSGK